METDILPYGYYEDKHWSDLESYDLKGDVKSRESFHIDFYTDKYTILDTTPELFQVLNFNKKGYLTYRKGYDWNSTYDKDTSSVTINYHYHEDSKSDLLYIIQTDSNQKYITWDEQNRIKKIEYQNISNGEISTNSSVKYEYFKNSSFRIKESRFSGNDSLTSYVNFNFNDKGKYLGWEQYWGHPLRLAESIKMHYDENNNAVATTTYNAIYDSIESSSNYSFIHINSYNQPTDFNYYNKDSTAIIASTTYRYDEKNRLIYKEYRNKESNQFEIEEFHYRNDLLMIEKNTKWQPSRDTIQNKSVMKYDNHGNVVERLEYLTGKVFSKFVHKIEYYQQ
ncbi:MAG: hypothetical protein ABJH17_07055 [Nonlabens ulvanivorans]|uniref:hypothetical protein n=1 Tax=Nonlabens ulvanivorans TaxID=906888 RepID=UPI003299C9E7